MHVCVGDVVVPIVGHFRPEVAHDWGTGPYMVAWALGCAFFLLGGWDNGGPQLMESSGIVVPVVEDSPLYADSIPNPTLTLHVCVL